MQDFWAAVEEALRLIVAFDAGLAEIVQLSMKVSIAATLCAAAIGVWTSRLEVGGRRVPEWAGPLAAARPRFVERP